ATNENGETSSKTVKVTVVAKPEKPTIPLPVVSGHDVTITVGSNYDNTMTGGSATVNGENVKVTYTGEVNANKVGTYPVTITATNENGETSSKIVKVTVVAKPKKPTIPLPTVNGQDTIKEQESNKVITEDTTIVNENNVETTYKGDVDAQDNNSSKVVETNPMNTDNINNPVIYQIVNKTHNTTTITQLPNTGISSVVDNPGVLETLVGLASLVVAIIAGAFGFKKKNKKNKKDKK
ncbi:MAG: immunoglobulin-like domain-containing protein, partial [Sarcina sp.]